MALTSKFGKGFGGGQSKNRIGPVRVDRQSQNTMNIPIQPAQYFTRGISPSVTNITQQPNLFNRQVTTDPSVTATAGLKSLTPTIAQPPTSVTSGNMYLPDLVTPVLQNIQNMGGLPQTTSYNDLVVMFAPVRSAMNRNRLWANRILGELGLPLSWARTMNADSRQQQQFYETLKDYLHKNYKDITMPKTDVVPTGGGGRMG